MNKFIKNETFQEERSLYNLKDATVEDCIFSGPLDGESPLKECKKITINNCKFDLRYPMWHIDTITLSNSYLSELCRAALWYCDNIVIANSKLYGIKALRECSNIEIKDCDIISPEFGWFTNNVILSDSSIDAMYAFLKSKNLLLKNLKFKGKYSFQYIENSTFENCEFDTKDAFWHGKNIIVKDSVVKGEYLAWYASNIKFINCKIIGTQPLCYCDGLELIDCEMIDSDLAFEKSHVNARILNEMISIKNPLSGEIRVKGVKDIIFDDENATGSIIIE